MRTCISLHLLKGGIELTRTLCSVWLIYYTEVQLFLSLIPEHICAFVSFWHKFKNSATVETGFSICNHLPAAISTFWNQCPVKCCFSFHYFFHLCCIPICPWVCWMTVVIMQDVRSSSWVLVWPFWNTVHILWHAFCICHYHTTVSISGELQWVNMSQPSKWITLWTSLQDEVCIVFAFVRQLIPWIAPDHLTLMPCVAWYSF